MNAPIPSAPFSKFVWSRNDQWADATALVCGVTEKELKYHELKERCLKFASVLQERLRLEEGQVVAVCLPNCLEYVEILFGAFEAGVVPTGINSAFTSAEIGSQLLDSGAAAIVAHPEKITAVKEACSKFELKNVKIVALGPDTPPDVLSYEKLVKEATPSSKNPILKSEHDTLCMPYSSGTSGKPKGVCLSHRNLLANSLNWGSMEFCRPTTKDAQEVISLVLPMYHIYGFAIVVDAIRQGAKVVVLPRLIEEMFIRSLAYHKASLLYAAPPLINYISSCSKLGPDELENLRTVVCGAAPMSSQDVCRFLEKIKQPVRFCQGYGATETSPMITDCSSTNFDSVGRPILNTMIKVVDPDTGKALGPMKSGEICVKGPQVMTGYLNNPQATREALDSNSWYHTGDIGHYDEDDQFFVTDRLKDLIKVKGFQVAPAEVEAALRTHPSVVEAGVVGVADSRLGETPVAFVALGDKNKVDDDALKAHLSKCLANYKIPSKFVHVTSIPKSASGKILRKDLKNLLNS